MKRPIADVDVTDTRNSSNDDNGSHFNFLRRFQNNFNKGFYNLGYLIGRNPGFFIIIPVFLTLIGITGFQRINIETDPDYLFVPINGKNTYARDTIEELFPLNSTFRFDPSRLTRNRNFAKLLITSKDNDTMFRTEVWDEVILVDKLIQAMTIRWEGQVYNYSALCSRWEGKCFSNMIYNLNDIMPEVANRSLWVSYPVMLFPLILPLFWGGVQVNESEGVLMSAQGVYTTYFLAQDDWKQKERAYIWEGALLDLLRLTDFENIQIAPYTSRSLKDELDKNSSCLVHFLPFSLILLLVFSILSVSMFDWVRSKIQMSVLGLFTVVMATCSSFGILMYIGVPFVTISAAAPFLILGIGLDDMFVMLAAWRRTKLQDPVPKRLAETYCEVAVSITVTSLTTLISFFIGTMSTFPAIQIFCIYLGTAILFAYIYFVFFFGGCLAIIGYMEKGQKHVLSCRTIKAKSEVDERDCCYRLWCTGGINKADPFNVKDNRSNPIAKCFRDHFAKCLNLRPIKGLVILGFFAYLIGAIYGFMQMRQGVSRYTLNLDDSYLSNYYSVEDTYFRKFPYRIQVVIKGNISYSDEATKEVLLDLHDAFENVTFVGPRLYTQSWIRGFYGYLRRHPELLSNITDEASFIDVLRTEYLSPYMRESLDVRYNDDYTRILGARFIVQGYEVKDMEDDKEMVRSLREVAEKAPFEVMVYHPTFVLYDQYLVVGSFLATSICVAALIMVVVSFFFVPNPESSLWIGLSVISINFGVLGYMSLWSVRLDTIAIVNLLMCIGFSVDFSAHISHSYLNSKANSADEKLRQCLYAMGLPVLQGGISTILAVLVFILTPSYIYRTFFKIIFLVTVFGMLHALVLLPVMLSLFDRNPKGTKGSHDPKGKKDSDLRFRNCVTENHKTNSGPSRENHVLTSTVSNASNASNASSESVDSNMTSISISSDDEGGASNPDFTADDGIEVERL